MPLPQITRFKKQSVFNLSGCRFDAAAALGSEDHQLGGMLPRTALLNMLGLMQDERSRVAEREKPGAVLEHERSKLRPKSPAACLTTSCGPSRRTAGRVAVVLFPYVAVTVPSGHVGVLWKRFGGGTVLDPRRLRDEGLHLILPWNELFIYDLRLQSITETYNAISSDGVSLKATMNVRFRLQRDAVPVLHQPPPPTCSRSSAARPSIYRPCFKRL